MRLQPIAVGVALLVAASIGDRTLEATSAPPPGIVPTVPAGGVLSCPVATTGSGDAFLHLANVGDESGRARVFIRAASGSIIQRRLGLAAGTIETIALHELTKESSGLAVEWSGGRIVASHSLHAARTSITPGRELPRFMSVAQCHEAQGPQLTIAAARTTQIGDTTLALFNPGPAAADVSIAIRTGGEYAEPQRLQRRIVRPLTRRDFSLRDFAFGTDEVAAIVTMNSGRVVAEAYINNRGGAELVSAVPPLSEALAIAGTSGGQTRLSMASTERALGVEAVSQAPVEVPVQIDASRYADGILEEPREVPARIGPGSPGQFKVPAFGGGRPVAYDIRPIGGRIAAAVSWPTRGERVHDLVAISATPSATTWFAVVPTFGPLWRAELLAVAAGGLEGSATLRVIGPRPRTETIDLPPGIVRRVDVSGGTGVHAIVVESELPIATAIVGRSGGIGYGSSASSLRIATATALQPEAVVGIGRGSPGG